MTSAPSRLSQLARDLIQRNVVLLATLTLAACGGGSSGADAKPTSTAADAAAAATMSFPGAASAAAEASAPAADAAASATMAQAAAAVRGADASPPAAPKTAAAPAAVRNTAATPSTAPAALVTAPSAAPSVTAAPAVNLVTTTAAPILAAAPLAAPVAAAVVNAPSLASGSSKVSLAATSAKLDGAQTTTSSCQVTLALGASLGTTLKPTSANDAGASFTNAELRQWRSYVAAIDGKQFVPADANQPGSVNDLRRIRANTDKFLAAPEPVAPSDRLYSGTLIRDAAFSALLAKDAGLAAKVAARLIKVLEAPENDFSTNICYRSAAPNQPMLDANFGEAGWFLRHVMAYDYVRPLLTSDADRARIEKVIRRQATFFAGQIDYGLSLAFPNRLSGDYSTRAKGYAAAPLTDADKWLTARFDTNGDCIVDAKDSPTAYPVYAYFDGTAGKVGPKLSVLSQWFNNRKSLEMLTVGLSGITLGDTVLVDRAKRYFMEWLTYAVYPDGSEGEYARNGDYCIPRQGTIYGYSNVQAALHFANWLNKGGDPSLLNFKTTDGLFGTESASKPKSLGMVASTYAQLAAGALPWYFNEPWKTAQAPNARTHLGAVEVRYNGGSPMDDYHELGLLLDAVNLPADQAAYLRNVILRKPAVPKLPRFPGSTGNPVATGLGNGWADAMSALPAIFLLDTGPDKR